MPDAGLDQTPTKAPDIAEGLIGAPEKTIGAMPTIKDASGYEALLPGMSYLDPEGKTRKKPFSVSGKEDYERVPEGEVFLDPEGQLRTKPQYEGVDFTTQLLHDMAVTPAEKKKALAKAYGEENVKQSPVDGSYYVETPEGRRLKPGSGGTKGFGKRIAADVLSGAAPVAGSVAGGILGAAGGGVPAVAGAAAGGAVGQGFNDLMLNLAGIYDRSLGQEAGELTLSGAMGGAGEGLGRLATGVAPAVRRLVSEGRGALPSSVAKLLGATADPEATRQAAELAAKGIKVPPSAWLKEAPYLHTAVETFDPKFRTQNVLREDAEKLYQEGAGKVLKNLGVEADTRELLSPTAAVSSEKAGAAALRRVGDDMAREDTALNAATNRVREQAKIDIEKKSIGYQQSLDELRQAEEANRKTAQKAVDLGFISIQEDIDKAIKVAGSDMNSGDLWTGVAQKFRGIRAAVMTRANKLYTAADAAAGDAQPDIINTGLVDLAKQTLDELPEEFKSKYPDVVKKISALGGEEVKEGKAKEIPKITFGQLRNLRSILRSNVNYYDLTPDVREGVFKRFAGAVDKSLHSQDTPELKAATELLDKADEFYAKNMKAFNDKTIQGVVSALESGLPADPKMLADTILKEGRSDLIQKVRRMVGPNLWNAIKAADTQEMLDNSKTLVPGQVDGKAFAKQVLDRVRSGTLDAIYDPATAARLRTQAQYIEALDGRLPVSALPGDTVTTLIAKSRMAADAAKEAAKKDPLGSLTREMKGIEANAKREAAKLRETRRKEPLGFLYDRTIGASDAADKILADSDLLFAAATKFGETSPEFSLLRQVYAQRMLTGTLDPTKKLVKATPELQRLMFPGVSLEEMQTLAKNMDFLLGSKAMDEGGGAGSSIAAQSRVLNPWGSITGLGKFAKPLKIVPGMETLGRSILTKYYQFLSWGTTHPAFVQWVAKGLDGTPEQREAVRTTIQKMMDAGGIAGAAGGELLYQKGGTNQ